MNKNELREEILHTMRELNSQIAQVHVMARDAVINVHMLRDHHGMPMLGPFLQAKAGLLHALALLPEEESEPKCTCGVAGRLMSRDDRYPHGLSYAYFPCPVHGRPLVKE